MTTALAELDQIIDILEAEIPGNPRSPKNQKLRLELEKEVARYFRQLEDAFPYKAVAKLYNSYVKESLGSETKNILDPLLATLKSQLQLRMNGFLATAYLSGSAEMISWGKTQKGLDIVFEGPPVKQAVAFAQKHGAKLVTRMDDETKRRLANVVSNGIKNKRGIPGLSRDIRKTFNDMSKYRSQLIARTETANALSTASLDRMEDMGVDGKEWVTIGDDRVSIECQANEAEGVIPKNQAFSGGTMAPPQHPRCRCSLAPAMLPTGKAK